MTRRLGIVVTGLLAPATVATPQVAVRVDDVAQDPSWSAARNRGREDTRHDWTCPTDLPRPP
jgi:hypothetical protein